VKCARSSLSQISIVVMRQTMHDPV